MNQQFVVTIKTKKGFMCEIVCRGYSTIEQAIEHTQS